MHIYRFVYVYVYVEPKIICLWIQADPNENRDFEAIAKFFKIWHEYKRGSYHGLHEFYFLNHYVMLFNARFGIERSRSLPNKDSSFAVLKPPGVQILPKQVFDAGLLKDKLSAQEIEIEKARESSAQNEELVIVRGPSPGMNCQEVSSVISFALSNLLLRICS